MNDSTVWIDSRGEGRKRERQRDAEMERKEKRTLNGIFNQLENKRNIPRVSSQHVSHDNPLVLPTFDSYLEFSLRFLWIDYKYRHGIRANHFIRLQAPQIRCHSFCFLCVCHTIHGLILIIIESKKMLCEKCYKFNASKCEGQTRMWLRVMQCVANNMRETHSSMFD